MSVKLIIFRRAFQQGYFFFIDVQLIKTKNISFHPKVDVKLYLQKENYCDPLCAEQLLLIKFFHISESNRNIQGNQAIYSIHICIR